MYNIIRNITRMSVKMTKKSSFFQLGPKCFAACNRLVLRRTLSSFTPDNVYLMDENDSSGSDITTNFNKYTFRTCTCEQLRIDNVGEKVTLCGWLEYQRMNKFVVLRDSYGQTQLLISDSDIESQKLLQSLPLESILEVKGTVLSRPEKMKNPNQSTGDIELLVEQIAVLNKAKSKLPFNVREFQKAKEALRMQYRYLDLRFPLMQRNLRARSQMIMKLREFLVNHSGFVDVETPTLFKATPGGAKEFIVPTRFPGEFYSLVQSPQQFKQMLMAGAIDRYFQIARCYRDEGARPDRQPEFTQLDIEMSFTNLDHILQLVEELLGYSWPEFLDPLPRKFQRISFAEAMECYGSDQPDVRMDFKLHNCTEVLQNRNNLIDVKDFGAYALVFGPEHANPGKEIKEKFITLSKQYPEIKFVITKAGSPKQFITNMKKLLGEAVAQNLSEHLQLSSEELIFLAHGSKNQARNLLGKVRVDYIDYLESQDVMIRKKGMHLLWVVDFPLFESDEASRLNSAHHPFTAPHPDDLHLLESDPLQVRGLSFDLVLNGNEIGGGSVRIHDPKLQEKIFDMLNIDKSSMSHIIEMLASGCPPHGGIALGLDRLLSKILKTTSIRDVIAFPKSFEGRDLLSGAPSPVSDDDKKLYHIRSIDLVEK